MAKDTNKKDPGYDVVDDAKAEEFAIQELKKFDRGFGIKIKTFEKENDLPDSLKKLIKQYYTAALIMIPNTSISRFPYDEKKSGAFFPLTNENVMKRCKRLMDEISFIISLYKKSNTISNENAKKLFSTYIKLLETDVANNIAHVYDIGKDLGSKYEKEGVAFESNYSSNGHLMDSYGSEREQLTRMKALNKFVRNSLSELNDELGISTPIDLNNFADSFVFGARAGHLTIKNKGIIELSKGSFDVTPVVIEDRIIENGKKKNQDRIMFIGKNGISAVVDWHLGTSGALSYAGALSQLPRLNADKIRPMVAREMPNYDTISHSAKIRFGGTDSIDYRGVSTLDKLKECCLLLLKKQRTPNEITLAKELAKSCKIPSELNENTQKLFSLAGVTQIVEKLQAKPL